jgi:CheY-like chemotaxis protein
VNKHVLIVDDDPSIRMVIEHALAGDGYAVTTVDDGAGVIDQLFRTTFDLVILDLYMPGMNGFEVLRQIREPASGLLPARRTPNTVKVMVVSAHSDPSTVSFVLKRGADLCLAKPFDLGDLLQATRQLLAPARARRRH